MPRKNESDKRKENEKENIVNNKNEDEKTTNKKENIKEEIAIKKYFIAKKYLESSVNCNLLAIITLKMTDQRPQ